LIETDKESACRERSISPLPTTLQVSFLTCNCSRELISPDPETDILTITENGYGKRTSLDEYPQYNRGGKGVINLKVSEKTGKIVSVLEVNEDEELMCLTSNGIVIRTSISEISRIGRATQGVRIMKVADEEKVAAITKIKKEEEELED